MRRAYKCRVYPALEQAAVLNRTFGCVRLVWNRLLGWRQARWQSGRASTNVSQANVFLTELKRDPGLAFLREVSSVPLQQVTRIQQKAVSRDPDGRWYVSLAVEVADPAPLPGTGTAVGVDLGITDFTVTSDGDRVAHPRLLERKACNLARYQRRMARCQPGSNNRAKAKAKIARAHRKVRAARQDFLHRTTTRLVRRYDILVVEDLNVAGMLHNRKLAKAISDSGWATFRRMLAYKAHTYGRHLIVIDRWYPSTKTCSTCRHLLEKLSLSTRTWTCPGCRTRHDRDTNAAKNILAAGLAMTACRGDIRHPDSSRVQSPTKQEPQPAKVGIPRP
ncbi:MAG TPA: RNA-guided endonuclease TnpB family protein [Micromonospora sp.]|nr:RNA-guided endonuclease TnpB family protein [Micromonospora sp.]